MDVMRITSRALPTRAARLINLAPGERRAAAGSPYREPRRTAVASRPSQGEGTTVCSERARLLHAIQRVSTHHANRCVGCGLWGRVNPRSLHPRDPYAPLARRIFVSSSSDTAITSRPFFRHHHRNFYAVRSSIPARSKCHLVDASAWGLAVWQRRDAGDFSRRPMAAGPVDRQAHDRAISSAAPRGSAAATMGRTDDQIARARQRALA